MARIEIIVMAASFGGYSALRKILSALPPDFAPAIFVVQHVGPHPSILPELLSVLSGRAVIHAEASQSIIPRHVYVAPPDWHMLLKPGTIVLDHGPKFHHTRPAADPLFMSAADAYGAAVAGVVLTGGDGDGAKGLKAIKAKGGIAIVQDPAEALDPSMPYSALVEDHPDYCLPLDEIARLLENLGKEGEF
jgi:two-component system, chemotaxis family, protein-glutamate methylesterase/glutaminase